MLQGVTPAPEKRKPRTEPGRNSLRLYLRRCRTGISAERASGDEALWHRLQPLCLSCRWKPRISIRGSTPSGVRKKRKHAKGFSPGPAPSGTAIPGCAPVECGQSAYRLLRHFSFSRHSFTLLAPSLSAAGRLRGERSRRATALHNRLPSAGFRREPVVFFQGFVGAGL